MLISEEQEKLVCVAGVALGDIALHFAWTPQLFVWQAWHLVNGPPFCGTWRHRPSLCVAGVALGDIHACTFCVAGVAFGDTLCGRRATYGTGLALVTRLGDSHYHFVAGVAFRALGWLWWRASDMSGHAS
eukprot:s443_g15.t1